MPLPHISTLVTGVKQEEGQSGTFVTTLPPLRSLDLLGLSDTEHRDSSSSDSSVFSTPASSPVAMARDLEDAQNHLSSFVIQDHNRYEPSRTTRPRTRRSPTATTLNRSRRTTSAPSPGSGPCRIRKDAEKRKAKAVREKGSRCSLGESLVRLQNMMLSVRGDVPDNLTPLKSNNAKNSGLVWKKEDVIDAAVETIHVLMEEKDESDEKIQQSDEKIQQLEEKIRQLNSENRRLWARIQWSQRSKTIYPRL